MNSEVIIGLAGLLLAVLTYFAGVQRQKYISSTEAKSRRIQRVVDRYLAIEQRNRVTGIHDLLRAGALTLQDSEEVYAACDAIVEHSMPSPLHNLSTRLDDHIERKELLAFLNWFQRERSQSTRDFHNQDNFNAMLEVFRKRPTRGFSLS